MYLATHDFAIVMSLVCKINIRKPDNRRFITAPQARGTRHGNQAPKDKQDEHVCSRAGIHPFQGTLNRFDCAPMNGSWNDPVIRSTTRLRLHDFRADPIMLQACLVHYNNEEET